MPNPIEVKRISCLLFLVGVMQACHNTPKQAENQTANENTYAAFSDSAKYVGMNECRQCHSNIYSTFIETGMGHSFGHADTARSSALFNGRVVIDSANNLRYVMRQRDGHMYMHEFRLENEDTTYSRVEEVSYIVGSGQHTNSHLRNNHGFVTQMPMTFYTQRKKWDLPPGFEGGHNTRFSRKIGLECMSCHNALPGFVMGSENKYDRVPEGIDCERCHGPGSVHVAQRKSNAPLDTAHVIDYSIVNPAKLSIDRQLDVCQRCHLQGNAVLQSGRSFYDFRPGMKLSDYISVFLPRYEGADEEFIMASHADRLKQSQCFIVSLKNRQSPDKLRPYRGALTCVTCHDPHVSVRHTDKSHFNQVCQNCHSVNDSKVAQSHHEIKSWENCVSCHMPSSGSVDIPHVAIHDHYIRKPVSRKTIAGIKRFVGLASINDAQPSAYVKARAYLQQFERFEENADYLDSAQRLIGQVHDRHDRLTLQLRYCFFRRDMIGIENAVRREGENICFDSMFVRASFDNDDAWSAYYVGESFLQSGATDKAIKWFGRAVKLAPFAPEFRAKLALTYATRGELGPASNEYKAILNQDPEFVQAYTNLGFIEAKTGRIAEAERLYLLGLNLEPDNEQLLFNLAALYVSTNRTDKEPVQLLNRILKKNPKHTQARELLHYLHARI